MPLFKYVFQSRDQNRNSLYPHAVHIPLGYIFNEKEKKYMR